MAKSVKSKKRNVMSTLRASDSSAPEHILKTTKRSALSGWPMIIGWLAMLIFAIHASTHMVAAGDTWVAMACGRHFINHGVDTVEPFSANSHKPGPTPDEIKTWPDWAQWIADKVGIKTVKYWHPTGWVNQNWLTHVIFYSLIPKSSYADGVSFPSNALVYWKFAIYIITVICVYYTSRLLGVNPALSAVFSCFAMFIGRSFLDIRPAGFSNLLVAVFLLILALTTYRNVLYIWLVVPLAVFWCNVHGGYIYMFIMLVPFIGLHLMTNCSRKWTAILYNVVAWPFLFFVLRKAGLTISTFLFSILVVVLDFTLIFFKERLVSIGWKGVFHTIASSCVAFLAMVVFNPFHLTNLTHTFVISVSEHAARWREIHEWHPAFDWTNPVGTSFPFLVLYILSIGLLALWLFSRFLKPKLMKAPRKELESQKRLFKILSKVFVYAASVLICWVTFVSLSLLRLDLGSFFLCAVFAAIILMSIYTNVHFIYLAVLLALLAVWSGNADAGYNGRYFYPFVIVPVYVGLHPLACLFSKTAKIKTSNIIFVILTAVASLLLMTVILNPFKFKMPIWHVDQFFGLQRIWRPLYERNVEISYVHLFDLLYIVNIIAIIIWLGVPYYKKIFSQTLNQTDEQLKADTYQWPQIDLSLIIIAALTVYMAIRSRRFIPIAGIAACPIVALFIDQVIRSISATLTFHKNKHLVVSPMSPNLQILFTIAGAIVVVFLGTWWGLKFKRVYLEPWPRDPKFNSIFMRMTDSCRKPFYALRFIKDNKLEGKMFNYWTEGGFIAWGQEPDPNTGRTPLRLFMDGRAQAAYNRRAFDTWSTIFFGGPIVQAINIRGQQLTAEDYSKIGEWVAEQLQNHNVWVGLMPMAQFDSPFVRGLEYNGNWRVVFLNDNQKILVDIRTPKGKEIFDGVLNGKTIYPDEFHSYLIRAHFLLLYEKELAKKRQGFDLAVRAFDLYPSAMPMRELMLIAASFRELQPDVNNFCENFLKEFTKNEDKWAKQHGHLSRLEAVRLACFHLRNVAQAQKNTKLANFYAVQENKYIDEITKLSQDKKW